MDEGCNEEGGTCVKKICLLLFAISKVMEEKNTLHYQKSWEEKKTLHYTLLLVPLQYSKYYLLDSFSLHHSTHVFCVLSLPNKLC